MIRVIRVIRVQRFLVPGCEITLLRSNLNEIGIVGRDKDLIGRRLGAGRFEILALLGHGAFAEVYRGRQINLHRDVAIKILHERDAQDDHLVKRFHHEASAIAQFDHPYIIKIFDHGEEAGLHYYVMNLLPKSLRSLLVPRQPLSGEFIIRTAHQLAGALDYAQRTVKNFLHRDIKPENMMLDREHNAMLSDFGLVRGEPFSQMTMRGTIMGTPTYMAPELWKPETGAIDERADLYALGITLYECAIGAPPFIGEPVAVYYQHLNVSPAPPRQRRPDLPPELEAIILRLIEKQPENRFASAAELMNVLSPLVKKLPDKIFIQPTSETRTIMAPPPSEEVAKTEPSTTLPVVSAETKPGPEHRRFTWRRLAPFFAAIVLVGVLAVLFPLWQRTGSETKIPSTRDSLVIAPQTSPSTFPAPSNSGRDGKSTRSVDLRTGETLEVAAMFKPQLAPLQIAAIPACEILVDSISYGSPSDGRLAIEIAPGRHELAFRHPLYGFSQRTVEVNEQIGLNYEFKWLGKITVIATDEDGAPIPAAIFLNGKSTNEKAPSELELPVGQHEIRVNKFEYEMVGPSQTLQIEGGDEKRLQFVLRRRN